MLELIEYFSFFSYFIIFLQGICVFHCIKKGNDQKWIWLIVFLPFIGSLIYLFTEVIQKRHVSSVQSVVGDVINPKGRISDLEKQFKYSNTFTNRVALADAYLAAGQNEKAIELYEPGLTGIFHDNELAVKNLIQAYYNVGRYEDIVRMAPRIEKNINFSRSHANFLYAIALEKTGKKDLAEKQYKALNHRFSNYEARYHYGEFLLNEGRKEDAALVFFEMVDEGEQMSRKERSAGSAWINKAKDKCKVLAN
ncbi:MAG: hypothetical protein K0S32_317 [Bacteroidetes bacterium]|jgi:hypothetical protein|nr:hypothetical protein [Bacteroidota bacterium]